MSFGRIQRLTHPRDPQRGYKFLQKTPETFTPLAVTEPKAYAFPWVVDELAWPLVAVCVKDRESECDPSQEFGNETMLEAATVYKATYIVQEPDGYVLGKVLE